MRDEMDAIEQQLTNAFRMARHGIPVVRLDRYSKHPNTRGWQKTATTDDTVIGKWDTPFNYAEVLPDEVVVVDVDGKDAGEAFQHQYGDLPDKTWIKWTPGLKRGEPGLHFYYRLPAGVKVQTRALSGVDIKGPGTALVGAGSAQRHGNVIGLYRWIGGHAPRDVEMAEAPPWLVELVTAPPASALAQGGEALPVDSLHIDDRFKDLIREGAPEGERSEALFAVERAMVQAGYPDADIIAVLMDERNGLSEKPRAQGQAWLESDIRRAREKPYDRPKKAIQVITAGELMKMNLEPPQMIARGLLPEGVGLMAGKGKVGKSLWQLQLALAVAGGWSAFGKYPVKQGEVLYLALEDDVFRLKERMGCMLNGKPLPEEQLCLVAKDKRCPLNYQQWLDEINDWLAAHPQARLVIIDTFGKIRDPRPGMDWYQEDYEAVEALHQLWRRGLALVVVHHMNKRPDGDDWVDTISASTGLSGAVDTLFGLTRGRGESKGTLRVTGRGIADTEATWAFDYPTWRPCDNEAALSANRKAIVKAIREAGCPLGPKETADATGVNYNTVRVRMPDMARKGQLKTDGDGKYDLP